MAVSIHLNPGRAHRGLFSSYLEPFRVGLILCVFLTVSGCGKKEPQVNKELEKAASAFVKVEPADAVSAPASPQPAPEQAAQQTPAPRATSAQEMNQAITAYKKGDLEDAVTRLQKLRATPVMSPQQRIAVNDAIAAVMTEIYTMASKGNARAIQAVKTYEELQTKPRSQ